MNKQDLLISQDMTIKEAMRRLSIIGEKQMFVVTADERLVGALSDGDIRKWILREGRLDEPVETICNKNPKFVREGNYKIEDVKQVMLELKIEGMPVVSADGRVKEVLLWDHVFAGRVKKHRERLNVPVIIMAGGKGTRLDPFTKILPKSLIPIGDKPIIEMIMDQFAEYGIRDFYISVYHKARMIKSYFEEVNGQYRIIYLEEKKPLGTAGGLKMLEGKLTEPFLVTNCDVMIESDYAELVNFHKEHQYDLTLVVSCRHYVIPYGVCEIENGGSLKAMREKPEHDIFINTGMYVMNNRILSLIPEDRHYNVTELIQDAKRKNFKIGVFPVPEKSWVDVGQWEEYYKAIRQIGEIQEGLSHHEP